MKKRVVLIGLAVVLLVGLMSGCVQKEPDISKKYIIFSDRESGIEFKYDCYSGGRQLTDKIKWEEGKSYNFTYNVYYTDNDQLTGESGRGFDISGEPGRYFIRAQVNLGGGLEQYDLFIEIDPPITWKFDPENTVAYTDNERYTYKYDENMTYQCPIPQLYFDGERPNLDDKLWDSVDWSWDITYKESGKVCRPKEIGVYEVTCKINYNWTNSGDGTSQYTFSQNFIIEIIQ